MLPFAQVRTIDQAQRLMRRGMEGKTMGPNYQHDHSSRSHTVVRLVVKDRDGGGRGDASLMLVDLAGSEAAHDNSSALATSEVRDPHHMDCPPIRWPFSPRIVVQCAP